MTINVKQNLVPQSKYGIKCPYEMDAEFITVHNTYNDATASAEVAYMIRNNNQVSFHYGIDDVEVVQGIPENRNSWNAGDSVYGDGNRKSISIEICYSKSGGERYFKAEALAVKFIAQKLKEKGWGIDRVRSHKSWTEIGVKKGYSSYVKNCPHRILDEGRWNQFLQAIEKELKGVVKVEQPKPSPTPQPAPVPKPKVESVTSNNASYIGKRVESKVNNLRFYNKPSWDDKDVVGHVNAGIGFPTIVDKVSIGGAYQYKVKNSNGATFYITASDKYVRVEGESKPVSKPTPKPHKSIDQLAQEVIDGKHGSGDARKRSLGNQYDAVQKRVNELLGVKPAPKPQPKKLGVGVKVQLLNSANKYATGQNIPSSIKGKTYTIMQVKSDRVLLKEIYSWVYIKDVK